MAVNLPSYTKRCSVTGGFKGFRYEIKLNSLILLRLLLHEDIEQFYIASNYDGVGAFDDICIKAKIKTRQRPFYVFIQAKHKEIHNASLDYDLMTIFKDSLDKVKAQFGCAPQTQDSFFEGVFNETDCMFILYTNTGTTNLRLPSGVIQEDPQPDDSLFKIVNDLIATRSDSINIGKRKKQKISASLQVIHHDKIRIVICKNQSNEKEIEDKIIQEIVKLRRLAKNDLVKADDRTLYLHYYYKVQEWWMEKQVSLFLSKTNNLYQDAVNNIVDEPYMTATQNGFYMNNIKYYKYDFTDHAVDSLGYLREYMTSIIVTDVVTLTTMKVICWLRRNCKNTYSVVALERVFEQPEAEFSSLVNEMKRTNKVLIVICNDIESNKVQPKRLYKLTDATRDKRVIVITDNNLYSTVKNYFDRSDDQLVVKSDEKLSLMELTGDSCKEILTDAKVTFQGQKVSSDCLVKTDSLIAISRGTVLRQFLQRETVSVGKSLRDEKYEEIQHLYIERRLSRASTCRDTDSVINVISYGPDYHTVSKFSDIDTDVVLLTSSAGMGKSTLLSHMSRKTNEADEKFWIVRINLLEHCSTFNSWKDNNTVINTSVMLNFLCPIALQHYKVDTHYVETDGKVKIIHEQYNQEANFELNLFLHFYNESKVIFLFDGFDEICPCYKDQVLDIINYVKHNALKSKMWVTSRPYKEILTELEQVVGESYILECINRSEQETYLQSIWQEKIPTDIINDEQRERIITDLETIKRRGGFGVEFSFFYDCLRRFIERKTPVQEPGQRLSRLVEKFLGIPLLIYLVADKVSDLIINFDINTFQLHSNTFQMYKSFIQKKLTIYFEIKYHVDLSMPKFKKDYENDLRICFDMYKNLGAYAVLRDSLFKDEYCLEEFKDMPFSGVNKRKIEALIEDLKGEKDTSGLISTITSDNLPLFIHRSFAEYFATEFVCDVFKSTVDINARRFLYAVLKLYLQIEMIYIWIPRKRQTDPELDDILKVINKNKLIGDAIGMTSYRRSRSWTMEQEIRVYASSLDDYEDGLKDILQMLEMYRDIELSSSVSNGAGACIANEMIARMKPHLKKYFPDPSHRMSLDELKAKIELELRPMGFS